MSWGQKLERVAISLFGSEEERDLLSAVQEGEEAAQEWYANNDEPPTRAQLLQMGLVSEGDAGGFVGGFITTDEHKKRGGQ
jgi:hypothetical protein